MSFSVVIAADVAVFLAAFAVTWLATPVAIRYAVKHGALAEPNERSVHVRPTPYLGGAAMYLGFVAALVVAALIPALRPVFGGTQWIGVAISATVLFAVMLVDDLRDISPPAKVAGMVLAAGILSLLGVTMTYFRIPFAGLIVLSSDVAPLVTAVWVVVMCNAMNLIDGLDGLAAGVAAIAGLAMFLFAVRLQDLGLLGLDSLGPVLCVAVAGMALGFLRWNFHPARVFMGDAGAMLLGLLLAAATMLIGGRVDDAFSGQTFFFFAPLVIPIVILGIPVADMVVSFVRRLATGRSFASADREHLHHRLLELGHGPRRTVLMIYAWTVLLSCVVLVPTYTGRGNAIVPLALAAMALLIFAVFHPGNPKRPQVPVIGSPGKHVRGRPPVRRVTVAPEDTVTEEIKLPAGRR